MRLEACEPENVHVLTKDGMESIPLADKIKKSRRKHWRKEYAMDPQTLSDATIEQMRHCGHTFTWNDVEEAVSDWNVEDLVEYRSLRDAMEKQEDGRMHFLDILSMTQAKPTSWKAFVWRRLLLSLDQESMVKAKVKVALNKFANESQKRSLLDIMANVLFAYHGKKIYLVQGTTSSSWFEGGTFQMTEMTNPVDKLPFTTKQLLGKLRQKFNQEDICEVYLPEIKMKCNDHHHHHVSLRKENRRSNWNTLFACKTCGKGGKASEIFRACVTYWCQDDVKRILFDLYSQKHKAKRQKIS